MNIRIVKSVFFLLCVMSSYLLLPVKSQEGNPPKSSNTGLADVNTFQVFYQQQQLNRTMLEPLVLPLGWMKGMSTEGKGAAAVVNIDSFSARISLSSKGLTDGAWTLWLLENRPGTGHTTMAEAGDSLTVVGNFLVEQGYGKLNTKLTGNRLTHMRIDRAFITRAGETPLNSFALTGATSLTDRLQLYPQVFLANQQIAVNGLAEMIAKGRDIFLNETFNGNGRTCATCHREEHNFTIDAKFIATLPPDDPLFVAETNPDLAKNFEKPELLRKLGLFVENVDGFDDLENKFTLRASSSILAVARTLKRPAGDTFIDQTFGLIPVQRLGWGGDGAPGSGTLREFALGAIIQHMTKSLNRKAGIDFRLPSDEELDALEAFQLSLGRSEELDLAKLKLKNKLANKGQALFVKAEINDGGKSKKCMECHFNAGANVGFDFARNNKCLACVPSDANGSFDIGTTDLKEVKDLGLPNDGGFGTVLLPDGGFGTCAFGECLKAFNTPSLVEAADTAPFFHHHLIATIEDAVNFYGTETFNKSHTGVMEFPKGVKLQEIKLSKKEVAKIAAFLRIVNVIENIRSAVAVELRAMQMSNVNDVDQLVKLATSETMDGLEVLSNGALSGDKSLTTSLNGLTMAKSLLLDAANSADLTMKLALVKQAMELQRQARSNLADTATLPASYQN